MRVKYLIGLVRSKHDSFWLNRLIEKKLVSAVKQGKRYIIARYGTNKVTIRRILKRERSK